MSRVLHNIALKVDLSAENRDKKPL